MRRWLGALLAVLTVAVLSMLLATPASAHTVLVGSDPADGSRLIQSPTAVTLRFNEQVGLELGYLRVIDSTGQRVDSGPATHPGGVGSAVAVTLRSGLGDGSYLASYRVTSADSHPVAGTVRYVVGDGPLGGGGGASHSAPVDRAVSTGLALSHWLSFAGVGLAGGSWLAFTLWPAGRRRRSIRGLVWTGWSLAGFGAITEYLLEGPYAAGSGLASIGDGNLLEASLHSNVGQLLSLRVLLLGILGVLLTVLFRDDALPRGDALPRDDALPRVGALPRDDRLPSGGPLMAAGVAVGIVVTFAGSGHTQSASPRSLWVLVNSLHLTAMIIWLGGVVVLLVAALSGGDGEQADRAADRQQLSAALPVFSKVAMACVATLAVTGALQAWQEIRAWEALTSTRYGQLVLVKVALFGGVLGLGYLTRRMVLRTAVEPARAELASPAGMASGPGAATGAPAGLLRRTLLSEVAIGALVLAATAVLISQPPGKVALAAERAKPQHITVTVSPGAQAVVDVGPSVHGNVQIAVRLSGGPPATAVTATASLPADELGPIPVPLRAAGPGRYASTVLLPAAGRWELSLTVRTSEFDSTVAVARFRLS